MDKVYYKRYFLDEEYFEAFRACIESDGEETWCYFDLTNGHSVIDLFYDRLKDKNINKSLSNLNKLISEMIEFKDEVEKRLKEL